MLGKLTEHNRLVAWPPAKASGADYQHYALCKTEWFGPKFLTKVIKLVGTVSRNVSAFL
jgi:hypothetical protein